MTTPTGAPKPALSVVIPFYGVEDYIEQCLVSVRDQLLTDVEVILVDDGSTDGSAAIAERFVAEDDRFSLVRQVNAGLGPARNTGAAHARGRYLTFVDSDDIVAPRGFFMMVRTLDETGSDFAAGNAKRFTAERGSYQSWTHAGPFDTTHLRTTLAERPDLIRDRMVWNKVYRRTFWENHELAFPAIRYEDYPVTLRAYVEAGSVDVLSDHVYFWRDRESGTSITQQKADLRNAADRYRSARMVMDVLHSHDAPSEVTQRVASYFAHVDLVSLAETMVSVDVEHQPEAESMAIGLATVIDPSEATEQTQVSSLLHRALRARDLTLARAVARWRAGGSNKQFLTEVVATKNPMAVAAVARAALASKAPQDPRRPRRLRSSLTAARWEGSTLHLTVETRLRRQLAHRARVEAFCEQAGVAWVFTPDAVERTPWGMRIQLALDAALFSSALGGHDPASVGLSLALPGQAMRWRGTVSVNPDLLPQPHLDGDHAIVVSGRHGLTLATRPADECALITAVPGSSLTLRAPETATSLTVARPDPTPHVEFPVVDGTVIIDPHAVLDGDVPDDPISGHYERAVRLSPLGTDCPASTYLVGDPLTVLVAPERPGEADGTLTLGRDADGQTVLRR